jgi:hypothetical protein
MDSVYPWTEVEIALLRRLILEAVPGGIYSEEPPLLWTRVAQRLRKKPLKRRIYSPEACREQYLAHIKPRLISFQYSLEEPPWSKAEIYSLRTHISGALPGGLDEEAMKAWSEIAEKVAEDGLVADTPLRLYNESNVREQYMEHIGPRFVSTGGFADVIKKAEKLDAVPSKAAASTKVDTNNAEANLIEYGIPRGGAFLCEDLDIPLEPLLGDGQFLEE